MKRIALACMAFMMACLMTACTNLDGLLPNLGEHVTVKRISFTDGITLSIKGVDCSFSFTTDRDVLLSEIKTCLVGDSSRHGLVMSAPPLPTSAGEYSASEPLPVEEPEVAPVVDEKTEKKAEEIADEIIKAIEEADPG